MISFRLNCLKLSSVAVEAATVFTTFVAIVCLLWVSVICNHKCVLVAWFIFMGCDCWWRIIHSFAYFRHGICFKEFWVLLLFIDGLKSFLSGFIELSCLIIWFWEETFSCECVKQWAILWCSGQCLGCQKVIFALKLNLLCKIDKMCLLVTYLLHLTFYFKT